MARKLWQKESREKVADAKRIDIERRNALRQDLNW